MELETEEVCGEASLATPGVPRAKAWPRVLLDSVPPVSRWMPVAYSLADQGFAVGGPFLASIALARTQSKEEFGIFVLSYSLLTFLSGLYNAAILEPYTVYGSGRYREHYSEYLRLMLRSNTVIGLVLMIILLSARLMLPWLAPRFGSPALTGLGLTIGVLLSAIFLRRAFYVERRADLAAAVSLVSFSAASVGLWLAVRAHVLDGFSVFLILALGWMFAGALLARKLALGNSRKQFLRLEPGYWREHRKYSQWALATAFVFQFTTQGYYWLVGTFLSAREVGELRAMYLLAAPTEQISIAVSFLVLPALATYFAAGQMGSLLSLWRRNALAVASVTGIFAVLVRLTGRSVMHLLYAGKFDGLAPLLYLLALSPILTGLGGTMANALNAVEKPKLVFRAYLSSGAATFLFGIPLVAHFGLRGAVYGMLISAGTLAGVLACILFLTVRNRPSPSIVQPS